MPWGLSPDPFDGAPNGARQGVGRHPMKGLFVVTGGPTVDQLSRRTLGCSGFELSITRSAQSAPPLDRSYSSCSGTQCSLYRRPTFSASPTQTVSRSIARARHVLEWDMEPDHEVPRGTQFRPEQESPVHDQDCIVRRRNHLGQSRRVVERVPIGEAASPVSPIRKRVEHPRSEQPVLIAKVLTSLYCVTAGLMARRVEVVD